MKAFARFAVKQDVHARTVPWSQPFLAPSVEPLAQDIDNVGATVDSNVCFSSRVDRERELHSRMATQ